MIDFLCQIEVLLPNILKLLKIFTGFFSFFVQVPGLQVIWQSLYYIEKQR